MSIWVLMSKEIREHVRTRRVVVLPAVFLFFGMLGPILLHVTPQILESQGINITMPPPDPEDSAGEYFESITIFGAVALILVAMGAVAEEKARGTIQLVMSKPVRRLDFLVAKFLIIALIAVGSIFVGGAACLYYTELLIGSLNRAAFFAALALLSLLLMFILSLTILLSTVLNSQVLAGGASIAVTFGLGFLPALGGPMAEYTPHSLARVANELLVSQAEGITAPVVATVSLTALMIVLTWVIFREQEL